ncbi:MAG: class I adenylate-forming enzyme family protein [Pirellulales bacterium]
MLNPPEIIHGVPQYRREHYDTLFADRHLVHGALRKWAQETPQQIGLIECTTDRQFTYRELDDLTTWLALALVEIGFGPGDYLATSLPLLAGHILLEYACFKIGVIHAPLDLRLKEPEVIRLANLIEPKGFAFWGRTAVADFRELGRAMMQQGPAIEHFFQFGPPDETIDGALAAATWMAEAESAARNALAAGSTSRTAARYQQITRSIGPDHGAQVIFTTGSTGLPKPALLSHRNITCQNMCLAGGLGMSAQTRILVNLPPSHVGCQAEELMTTFFVGGTALILEVFDAHESLHAISAWEVNTMGQIPAMFQMEWRLPDYDQYNLSSLEMAIFGGQQVTRPFVEQLLHMVPHVGTGLGLTELAGFVTYTGKTDRVEDLVDRVGWPMPITPLSIRQPINADGTAGATFPDGKVGEICFSGPQVFVDYVNDPDAYRQTVSSDGICYTGDLGCWTERGLVFKGRSKLVIKPKGYQVHPAEIENHFAALEDQVACCGAVGAVHEVFGEAVVLFVEPKPGGPISREQLEKHARGIAGYMRPLHYVLLPAGGFPLNRVSKTDYVRLAEWACEEVDRLRALGEWDR